MTFFIRRSILFFLVFELIIFFVIYCFGPKSLKTLYDVRCQKKQVELELLQLAQEIEELKSNIEQVQTSFAKEKIAREVLLMKQDQETVYFVKP